MARSKKRRARELPGQFFPFHLDPRFRPLFAVLGVNEHDGVVLGGQTLVATYGRWRVVTAIDNISSTEVSGPHRWYTAVGLRLSFADDGLTFGTNSGRGLCVSFREPVPRVIGLRDHSAVWLSVADPPALAAAIARGQRV